MNRKAYHAYRDNQYVGDVLAFNLDEAQRIASQTYGGFRVLVAPKCSALIDRESNQELDRNFYVHSF